RDFRDQQHVGTIHIEIEPLVDVLPQYRRSKRTKALPIFHFEIKNSLHRWAAGVGENRTRPECPRTEFHSTLKPADRLLAGEGPSRVASCRLNPNLVEAVIAKHFAVGDAIECHTSSKTEMTRPGLSGQRTGEAQDRLLRHTLNRGRKIHVDLLEPILRFSDRY